jgi:site-specific recombinase XerD
MKEKFLGYIAYNRCLSPLTVLKYRKSLEKFDLFLRKRRKTVTSPKVITLDDVSDFVSEIIEQGLTPTYCN